MRWLLLLGFLALLLPWASGQAIDQGSTGLFAYVNVGGPINLATFNAAAAQHNSDGLFAPNATGPLEQENFTEGEVWFGGGADYASSFCFQLPMLMEDSVSASERSASSPCTSRWGYAGGNYQHRQMDYIWKSQTTLTGQYASYFPIKVRVRKDGWVMAYVLRADSTSVATRGHAPSRAALTHWAAGGAGHNIGRVDDTVLGVAINRTLQVLDASGAASVPAYSPSIVNYYDFEYVSADMLMIGGRGVPYGMYSANSFGFSFNPGTASVIHASMSFRVRTASKNVSINGKCFAKEFTTGNTYDDILPSNECTNFALYSYSTSYAERYCTTSAGYTTARYGVPFFARTINTTYFDIAPNTWSNVTSDDTEFKAALWLYLDY